MNDEWGTEQMRTFDLLCVAKDIESFNADEKMKEKSILFF